MSDSVDTATIAAFAAAFAAIFGPIVSVAMAHWLTKTENKRQEAGKLFRRIMEDSQTYRQAFQDVYQFRLDMLDKQTRLRKSENTIVMPTLKKQQEAEQALIREVLKPVEDRYFRAFKELRSYEGVLNADVYSLGLLFDKQSKQCGRAIRDLIAMQEIFNREEIPSFEACQDRLNELVQRICQAMKPLYESLRKGDDD